MRAQREDKEGQEVDKVEKKSSGKLHSAWKYIFHMIIHSLLVCVICFQGDGTLLACSEGPSWFSA